MLHVDIWRDGRAIALDGGTFSYNSAERFTALGAAAQHNVLTMDGREPMEKLGRFLYLPWPHGSADDLGGRGFGASHDGYSKLGVRWDRRVSSREGGGFVVHDRVTGAGGRKLCWRWRLADLPWKLDSEGLRLESRSTEVNYTVSWRGPAACQSRLLRADPSTSLGWWSPHYGAVEPACALVLDVDAAGDVDLEFQFIPGD
jgi:hypothetical protein